MDVFSLKATKSIWVLESRELKDLLINRQLGEAGHCSKGTDSVNSGNA